MLKSRTLRHISSLHKTNISRNQHFRNASAAGFVDTGLLYLILSHFHGFLKFILFQQCKSEKTLFNLTLTWELYRDQSYEISVSSSCI